MTFVDSISSDTTAINASPSGACLSSAFEQFATGQSVTSNDIKKILAAARCEAVNLKSIQYGYFRKVTTQFTTPGPHEYFAKIALHPYSASMLEQESAGIAAFKKGTNPNIRVPNYKLSKLTDGTAVAVMDTLPGKKPGSWAVLKCPHPPFHQDLEWVALSPFIDTLLQEFPENEQSQVIRQAVNQIPTRFNIDTIPLSPAHGDFVYWNVLNSPNGGFSVLDFENYKPAAIAGYDIIYWHILPFTRFALRHSLARLQKSLITIAASSLQKICFNHIASLRPETRLDDDQMARCVLAIMLSTHAGQMLSEHQMPDIRRLIGDDALALRNQLCRQYAVLLEGLLR